MRVPLLMGQALRHQPARLPGEQGKGTTAGSKTVKNYLNYFLNLHILVQLPSTEILLELTTGISVGIGHFIFLVTYLL